MSGAARSVDASAESAGDAGRRLTVAEPFSGALAGAGIGGLNDLFELPGGERLDKATLPSWRERLRIELPGVGVCYLKRYSSPPVGVQVRRMLWGGLRASTARLEWRQIRRLEAAGIGSVRRVAFGEEMAGLWERRSAVLTAELPGESLEVFAARCRRRVARGWVGGLAEFVARFHGAGYVHRDLYLCHVFVEETRGAPTFRLIDLARMMKPWFRRRRWVVKDLAALNYSAPAVVATAADRLRFLKAYLGVARLGAGDRRLARQIARKTRRIARHDARVRRATRTDA